jgi:hypothetical protein
LGKGNGVQESRKINTFIFIHVYEQKCTYINTSILIYIETEIEIKHTYVYLNNVGSSFLSWGRGIESRKVERHSNDVYLYTDPFISPPSLWLISISFILLLPPIEIHAPVCIYVYVYIYMYIKKCVC